MIVKSAYLGRLLFTGKSLIPKKYASEKESPLRFEVKGTGANEYAIILE